MDRPLYAWRIAHAMIARKVERIGRAEITLAWRVAVAMIDAYAESLYAGKDRETAQAMAWEDFEMACRDVGMPGMSGPVGQLASRLCPLRRNSARVDAPYVPWAVSTVFYRTLNRAFRAAVTATPPGGLRYPLRLRELEIPMGYAAFYIEARPVGVDTSAQRSLQGRYTKEWRDSDHEDIFGEDDPLATWPASTTQAKQRDQHPPNRLEFPAQQR